MNKILLLAILWSPFLDSCNTIECEDLPQSFISYAVACKTIRSADFKIEEKINTSNSSWVRGASYYSCDGIVGFFILKTDDGEYLHAGLPLRTWESFKAADSFGGYYVRNIKGRYKFRLNK